MGLENLEEEKIKNEISKKIFETEFKSLEKIKDKMIKEGNKPDVYHEDKYYKELQGIHIYPYFYGDRQNKFNKDDRFNSEYINNSCGIVKEIDNNSYVGIYFETKGNGNFVQYTFCSPETGDIVLSNLWNFWENDKYGVRQNTYSDEKSTITGNLYIKETKDIEKIDISQNTTLRDIVAGSVEGTSITEKYKERIMSAFDEILSLDEEREVTPLTDEELARIESVRTINEMKEKLSTAENEIKKLNEKLASKEEELNTKDNEIAEKNKEIANKDMELKDKDATNKRLADLVSTIKERVNKIPFFGKKALQDIEETEKQLPAGNTVDEYNHEDGNNFKKQYEVDVSKLSKDNNTKEIKQVEQNINKNSKSIDD